MNDPTLAQIRKNAEAYRCEKVVYGYYLENEAGDDYGLEFCEACARKAVAQERANGEAWALHSIDESSCYDGTVRCHECLADLECSLTEYGAERELDEFERNGFDITSGRHCHYWTLCEEAWLEDSAEYKRLLAVTKAAACGVREEAK